MKRSDVLFLCTERELDRERAGMWKAMQGLATVRVLPTWFSTAEAILEWWHEQAPGAGLPILLWPDPHATYLPDGLSRCAALTACWHIDSFSAPEWRAEHAALFDVTFVFHPPSVARFRELGVRDVHLLPHAVRSGFFPEPKERRTIDVAFVGSFAGAYEYRRACLAVLAGDGHSMNDFQRAYDYADLAATYRSARIGVNVPQDHYLQDANLRCFEVMAAGALLLTPSGSELRDLGFMPGRHYIEFGTVDELREAVRRFLVADGERTAITDAARRRVLAEFTYDASAKRMLAALDRPVGERLPESAAHRIGLRYFARRGSIGPAARHFGRLAAGGALNAGDARDLLTGLVRAARARVTGGERP